jgi:hypothetical protein
MREQETSVQSMYAGAAGYMPVGGVVGRAVRKKRMRPVWKRRQRRGPARMYPASRGGASALGDR